MSCGPDHSGRALRRIFKPGFLAKMLRTNAPGMYGWRTLLYGTLLPGPQIARSFPEHLRALAAAGHEIGVHGYDHVYWHDRLNGLGADATTAELRRGLAVFAELTGTPATAFAAPGWQCTANSLAAIDAAGLRYHSCTRGRAPYRPVAGGRVFATPEIPTTWPTLDEVYGRVGTDAPTLNAFYRAQVQPGLNVHTIHAEVEGMSLRPLFEALLDAFAARRVRAPDRRRRRARPSGAAALPGRQRHRRGPRRHRRRAGGAGVKAVLALLLAAATLAIYLYGAHGFALADPDEARYGEIAREMIDSGDWVTPRLNHVKYFEKPPLVYWATALAIVTFRSERARRAPADAAGRPRHAAADGVARPPPVRSADGPARRRRSSPPRRCSRSWR